MHRRQAIREAIVALLAGLPNVGEGRVYPYAVDELPSVDVVTSSDVLERETMGGAQSDAIRVLTVDVVMRAEGDGYLAALDTIALAAEQAIAVDRSLAGLSDNLRLMATELEVDNTVGETPIAALTQTWEVTYTARSIDPQ